MNGRISKLLRKVFDNPLERRAFRRAYIHSNRFKQAEARQIATKIKDARDQGHKVNRFRINPETHGMEPVKADDEHS